jgi:cell division protein FtsL
MTENLRKNSIVPLVFVILLLSYLLIYFRMKSLDQDYEYNKISKTLDMKQSIRKELHAQKAHLLSASNLRKWSKKFKLQSPSEDQIILIP